MLFVNIHKGFWREIMLRYELMGRQVHICVHTLIHNHFVFSSAKIPFQIVAFCQRIWFKNGEGKQYMVLLPCSPALGYSLWRLILFILAVEKEKTLLLVCLPVLGVRATTQWVSRKEPHLLCCFMVIAYHLGVLAKQAYTKSPVAASSVPCSSYLWLSSSPPRVGCFLFVCLQIVFLLIGAGSCLPIYWSCSFHRLQCSLHIFKNLPLPEWSIQIPTGGVGLWKLYVKDGIPHVFQHPQLLNLGDLKSIQAPECPFSDRVLLTFM